MDGVVSAAAEEDEAVGEPGCPVERLFAGSAKPDRDGVRRPWYECGSVDPVEAARGVDNGFGEQAAEQLDLFFLSATAGMEVLAEGLVLDVVPADADAQA